MQLLDLLYWISQKYSQNFFNECLDEIMVIFVHRALAMSAYAIARPCLSCFFHNFLINKFWLLLHGMIQKLIYETHIIKHFIHSDYAPWKNNFLFIYLFIYSFLWGEREEYSYVMNFPKNYARCIIIQNFDDKPTVVLNKYILFK